MLSQIHYSLPPQGSDPEARTQGATLEFPPVGNVVSVFRERYRKKILIFVNVAQKRIAEMLAKDCQKAHKGSTKVPQRIKKEEIVVSSNTVVMFSTSGHNITEANCPLTPTIKGVKWTSL